MTEKVDECNDESKKIKLSDKALMIPETAKEAAPAAMVEDNDSDVVSVDIDAVIAKQEAEDAE